VKIDCVFSGGGIRGYALIGAIKAIEERGLSFVRVAGTSAGSILAAFVAAGYTADELEQLMEEINLEQFLDARKSFILTSVVKWFFLYWRLGLYKGQVLEKWLEEKLLIKGIRVFGDLSEGALKIVASDVTNSRMIVFPDDLPRYGYDPKTFSIAKAIRMSAGIPYFFEPVRLDQDKTNPLVVDGALLSNFPVWLFEQKREERKRPLLGIQLSPSLENRPTNEIKNAIGLFKALFETMMDAHDLRYISRSLEKDIVFIPVKNVLTREFSITFEQKKEMIQVGHQRTINFLKQWAY
jgi:NTE family protein